MEKNVGIKVDPVKEETRPTGLTNECEASSPRNSPSIAA